jgi:hypothetical protein
VGQTDTDHGNKLLCKVLPWSTGKNDKNKNLNCIEKNENNE